MGCWGICIRLESSPRRRCPWVSGQPHHLLLQKVGGQPLGVVPLEAPSAELRGIGYGYRWQEGWASEENQAGDPLQEKECTGLGSPTGGGQSWVEFLVPLWARRTGDGCRDADAQVGCGDHYGCLWGCPLSHAKPQRSVLSSNPSGTGPEPAALGVTQMASGTSVHHPYSSSGLRGKRIWGPCGSAS